MLHLGARVCANLHSGAADAATVPRDAGWRVHTASSELPTAASAALSGSRIRISSWPKAATPPAQSATPASSLFVCAAWYVPQTRGRWFMPAVMRAA